MNKHILDLYFIAGTQDCRHLSGDPSQNLLNILEQALKVGINCFQFRDKGDSSLAFNPAQQRRLAQQCFALCKQYQVPFIVNDNVQLALDIQADGIHVGQSDMAIAEVIPKIRQKMWIGLSCNNIEQAVFADNIQGVDYLGVGPIFHTQSKADQSPALGLAALKQITSLNLSKPIVAIGGINLENAWQIRQQGDFGIAVISAITQAKDIGLAVDRLK